LPCLTLWFNPVSVEACAKIGRLAVRGNVQEADRLEVAVGPTTRHCNGAGCQLRRLEVPRRRENEDQFGPGRLIDRLIAGHPRRTFSRWMIAVVLRIFRHESGFSIGAPIRGGESRGWSGRATVFQEFHAHWLRLLRGSVQ